jgi:hypothetical protein
MAEDVNIDFVAEVIAAYSFEEVSPIIIKIETINIIVPTEETAVIR